MYFATDGAEPPARTSAGHATIFPYGPYDTADGTVMLGLQNNREWKAFCQNVLLNEELADDDRLQANDGRFAQREEINAHIQSVFQQLTTSEAIARLEKAGIGTASMNTMDGLWKHKQLKARNRWQNIETPTGSIPALKPVSGNQWQPRMDPVPALGEHTQSILDELQLDKDTVEQITRPG